MEYTFEMSANEIEAFEKWQKLQTSKSSELHSAVGGRFTIAFTRTNLGTIIEAVDNNLNERIDISDYKNW